MAAQKRDYKKWTHHLMLIKHEENNQELIKRVKQDKQNDSNTCNEYIVNTTVGNSIASNLGFAKSVFYDEQTNIIYLPSQKTEKMQLLATKKMGNYRVQLLLLISLSHS